MKRHMGDMTSWNQFSLLAETPGTVWLLRGSGSPERAVPCPRSHSGQHGKQKGGEGDLAAPAASGAFIGAGLCLLGVRAHVQGLRSISWEEA